MSNESKLKKNIIIGLGGQLIVMFFGIIIPRIMIVNYGSDVNGLVSTITQIFTYMALLEAGIGQASRNILFKYFANGDKKNISKIASLAMMYYRKVTVVYGICVIVMAFLLPIGIKSDVDYFTIFFVVLFHGMAGVVSFYFIQNQKSIFLADGRSYFINGVETTNKVASYITRIVMAYLHFNIAYVQFVYFVITVLKAVIYSSYFKKKYGWIKLHRADKSEKLPDRNSYIITEIAWTIFMSTDMIVLSIFVSAKLSSVYSVYNMIFTSLNVLLDAVYSSINYELGMNYHRDLKRYKKIHYTFMSIFVGGMTVLMSTTYLLIMPFIKLYTNGINDANYLNESLPLLFCLVQIISWSRYIQGNLTGVAGYAKSTSRISLIEALINITLSIVLVPRFGIVGVLIATVIALPLKVIYCTYISDKVIFKDSYVRTISILGINYMIFGVTVFAGKFIKLNINSYFDFLINGIFILIIILAIGIILNTVVNRECIEIIRNYIRHRKGN